MSRPHKMLPASFRNGVSVDGARATAATALTQSTDLRDAIALAEQKLLIELHDAAGKDLRSIAKVLKDLAAARSSLNADARESIRALGDSTFMQQFAEMQAVMAQQLPPVDPPSPVRGGVDGDLARPPIFQAESFHDALQHTAADDEGEK